MNTQIQELLDQVGGHDTQALMNSEAIEKFAELLIRRCGYYSDIFEAVGCPVDMDPTDTKPSDYIKTRMGL